METGSAAVTLPILTADDIITLARELGRAGFTVDIRQHLDACAVVDTITARAGCGESISRETLCNVLAPVFCTTPVEQDSFREIFIQWIELRTDIAGRLHQPTPSETPPVQPKQPFRQWINGTVKRVIAFLVITLLPFGVTDRYWRQQQQNRVESNSIEKPKESTSVSAIHGTVFEPDSVTPLANAQVGFSNLPEKVSTDSLGHFSLSYTPTEGQAVLQAFHEGYRTATEEIPADGSFHDSITFVLHRQVPSGVDNLNVVVNAINALAAEREKQNRNHFLLRYNRLLALLATGVPCLLFLLWLRYSWVHRKAFFKRRTTAHTPEVQTAHAKGISAGLFHGILFRQVLREYRRRTLTRALYLDTVQSARRTARNCGLFEPVFGQRNVLPEYLILIDRRDYNDQYAHYISELIESMRNSEIPITLFYFDHTPRYLRGESKYAEWTTIEHVANHYPHHRLLLFSDGKGFFNPLTGKPYPWIDTNFPWKQRGIFLPSTTGYAAAIGELLTDKGFTVYPATMVGLSAQIASMCSSINVPPACEPISSLPVFLRNHEELCLERLKPSPAIITLILNACDNYLDENGRYLIAACAAYPELHYELTFYLAARHISGTAGTMSEEQLETVRDCVARVTHLPWFRYGFMPDWLRIRLLSQLSATQHRELRKILDELIKSVDEYKKGKAPSDPIPICAAQFTLAHRIEAIKTTVRTLLGKTSGEPMHDAVFAHYIIGGMPSLSLPIPESVQKLFFRHGNAVFGIQPVLVFLFTLYTVGILTTTLNSARSRLPKFIPLPTFKTAVYNHSFPTTYAISEDSVIHFEEAYRNHRGGGLQEALNGKMSGEYLDWLITLLQKEIGFDTARYMISNGMLTVPSTGEDEVAGRFVLWSKWKPSGNAWGMEHMAYIPGGTFIMGSPENEKGRGGDDEKQHEVTVSGFYMDSTEVTQEEFERVMGVNPSRFKDCPECPVEQASWYDAVLYANARTKLSGSTDTVYSYTSMTGILGKNVELQEVRIDYYKKGFRLPTEAEWEYACRAGTTTPFSFGATITPEQVNYDGNYPYAGGEKGLYREKTVNVASLPANAWGLYGMHGNVYEWCNDWYGEYPDSSVLNPQGPERGNDRVLRGGSWISDARYCRSAIRFIFVPGYRIFIIGFRLIRGQ